ncbi:TetR/AcrR family transcriptional regulator [Microbacterium sp. 179-B 1A2 NHS]|uniref:TetR/AcrR family transcriptional regulator n=1 Tax=Microbacterium sp. 179-B 1A2 NHS TaxID=3142383 RepID=UPI0039A2D0A7
MSIGRPRASSRASISEAACELFLERGYDATSVTDIATRAGVSRSSFFNYFDSKAAILWSGLDERIARFEDDADAGALRASLEQIGRDFQPDVLALALTHADAMGLRQELDGASGARQARIGRAVSRRLARDGVAPVAADVAGAAHGGAVLAAIRAWARDGAGRSHLDAHLRAALDIAGVTLA